MKISQQKQFITPQYFVLFVNNNYSPAFFVSSFFAPTAATSNSLAGRYGPPNTEREIFLIPKDVEQRRFSQ